jgi:hypothetical protein
MAIILRLSITATTGLYIHVIQTHEEAHIIGWMEAVKVADETNL